MYVAHPDSTLAMSQIRKAVWVASDEERADKALCKIGKVLFSNGYPKQLIQQAYNSATRRRTARRVTEWEGNIVLPFILDTVARRVRMWSNQEVGIENHPNAPRMLITLHVGQG